MIVLIKTNILKYIQKFRYMGILMSYLEIILQEKIYGIIFYQVSLTILMNYCFNSKYSIKPIPVNDVLLT